MKKNLLLLGMVFLSSLCFAQVSKQNAIEIVMDSVVGSDSTNVNVYMDPYPIEHLVATVYGNDTVSLTWSLPQCYNTESITLTWMTNEEIEDYTSYGYDSFMGHLYDANDLQGVVGRRIESVTFQKVSDWRYYVYIWKQSNGSEMETMYSQIVPENVPMGENTIYVDEELYIEPNTQYWISIRAKIPDGYQSKDLYPFCQGGLPIVN